MIRRLYFVVNAMLLMVIVISCKKLVEVDAPTTSVTSKNIYDNDATAVGALTSLYVVMSTGGVTNPGSLTSISCIAGLSSDELNYYSPAGNAVLDAYYRNALTNSNSGGTGYWGTTYAEMYVINSAIEGLSDSKNLNLAVKNQLLGEAMFMRAFYYFYLVNLYGDVPLVLTTDYSTNALIGRSPKNDIYGQIVKDLQLAQNLMSASYLKSDAISEYSKDSEERVRPTKWAATALLARTYLYMGDWVNAEIQSGQLISNTSQFNLENLDHVFLKNNKEAIWQLQPTQSGFNTLEANTFILPDAGPSNSFPVFLNDDLVKSFEKNDERMKIWIGSTLANNIRYYYPAKYKVKRSSIPGSDVTEYCTVLRLAEQFLIRAEARIRQNNHDGAIKDLDVIRKRAGLALVGDLYPNINNENLLEAILEEKRIELFSEWGHRWLDIKRVNKVNEIMTLVTPKKSNGQIWKSYQQIYPISLNELNANPSLRQSEGY